MAHNLITPGGAPVPIDFDGKFTHAIPDFEGLYIKDADPKIQADLKAKNRLVCAGKDVHSYPFCWRS